MDKQQVLKWLDLFAERIKAEKQYLSDLDSAIGDGDHGMNMARGLTALQEAIEKEQPTEVPAIFKLAAMTLISKVGGASGPLYGSAFLGMSKASETESSVAAILAGGLAQIKKRGKAEVGEKTMVDVWQPVMATIEKSGTLSQAQITAFVEATKDIQATKGRASYLGERSIGHLDPGAVSSGYLFDAMLEAGVLG